MEKELYIYSPIWSYTAEKLMADMEENKDNDIVIRSNTPGGSVAAGWGMIAKMKEHKGGLTIKVDGVVASMGAIMLPFAKKVIALDVSRIMLHKADMLVESEQDKNFLASINKELKQKLSAKIDNEKLKELKGIGIDELFADGERIDMWLTAKEAKAIGLVDSIVKLETRQEIEAYTSTNVFSAAAIKKESKDTKIEFDFTNDKNYKTMNAEKLKSENPELYKEIFNMGVSAEKDRVESCLVYADIDIKAVKEAIESGKPLSEKQKSELSLKALNSNALKALEEGAAEGVTTKESEGKEKTEKEKELEAFRKNALAEAGVKVN